MNSIPAPDDLGPKALELWTGVTGAYQLRADERRLLEDACREIDLIERMREALPKTKKGLTVTGSRGQPEAHPFIGEMRQHRMALANLLKQLKLTDLGAGEERESDTTTQARKAANARWGRHG